mgnify:FL=1
MNYKMMGKFISRILMVEAVFMLPALLISIFHKETKSIIGFVWSILITFLFAGVLMVLCNNSSKSFYAREGLVCVGISWIVMSLLGCLPFFISGEIPNFMDALFETVSGFTTTGATILGEVEAMSRGCLYWRSFTHWLGGMGVLVFVLAIGSGGDSKSGFTMHLLRAESPGPKVGKLVPKMKTTAEILYAIYIILTILNILFLLLGKMPLFDAVCTAFGTAGTGGFGIKNDSIAGYSPFIQNVCTVFMLLFGVNFSCYYMILIKQLKSVWKDEELRFYLGAVFASIFVIAWNIRGIYDTIGETLRHAAFQVASIVTTTGFATTDFDLWPALSKMILLTLMLIGASAGSTGGGFKFARLLLILKSIRRNIRQVLQPQKIQVVRVNGQPVDEKILENTNAYLAIYVIIIVVSCIFVAIDGFSMTTNISAVIACFNNVGPGFEAVGATCNFAGFGYFSKLVLIMDMLAGRLEIFPILILFSGAAWRHK